MIQTDNIKKVFLLGGADLEMTTIKKLLEKYNYIVVDKGLNWSNAVLDAYAEELQKFSSEEYKIYGVELHKNCQTPGNYVKIDHHNDLQDGPSALEQVAEIIGHQLTEEEQLIAENDKGYYPAMDKYLKSRYPGKSESELYEVMNDIRKRDRVAQGSTQADEEYADILCRSVEVSTRDITFVNAGRFMSYSPICDRLWPYDRLVVYNDALDNTELTFYGKDASSIYCKIKRRFFADKSECTYSGGGTDGYWGVRKNVVSPEKLREIINFLKTMRISESYHSFYFPFVWKMKVGLDELSPEGGWQRVGEYADVKAKYDEMNYFYKFVHEKLYDGIQTAPDQLSQIYHFRQDLENNPRYIITTTSEIYDLKLTGVELKLYTTGVGLLSFNLLHDSGKILSADDVLNINQFGRRVFPPFYADITEHIESAKSICITGLKTGDIVEDFTSYLTDSVDKCWKAASFIDRLLKAISPKIEYTPAIDDRMFVMSWYKNTDLVLNAVTDYSNDNNFWYRYLYVDKDFPMCQDSKMRNTLIEEHTYRRWADYGTLFGVTRYSMVMLLKDDAPGYLTTPFETMYSRMVELVLMQRASVLKFSDEVNDINNIPVDTQRIVLYKKVIDLCHAYIKFKNQFYFKEVTAQEQGIELYDMLQRSQRLDEMVKDLDEDIQELYQYHSIMEEHDGNKKAQTLNLVMSLFTPASCLAALLALGSWLDTWTGSWDPWYLRGLGVAIAVIVSAIVGYIFNKDWVKSWVKSQWEKLRNKGN